MLAAVRTPCWKSAAALLPARLWTPRPARYFTDYLLSWAGGCVACYWAARAETPGLLRSAAFAASVLLIYRAAAFLHEVVHQPRLRAFRFTWNLLTGIPLLCPSFLYATHLEHHAEHLYGTAADGEYVPWARDRHARLLRYFLISAAVPVIAIARFAIAVPLSWLIPSLRVLLETRGSSLVLRDTHRRRRPGGRERRVWRIQEIAGTLWILTVLAATRAGLLSPRWLLTAMAVYAMVNLLNAYRTVLSHRFGLDEGRVSHDVQVADSVNHPEGRLVELICPIGLRYHALHHMLSGLPYHSLAEAHRVLARELPPGAAYHRATSPNLRATWRQLVSAPRG